MLTSEANYALMFVSVVTDRVLPRHRLVCEVQEALPRHGLPMLMQNFSGIVSSLRHLPKQMMDKGKD
jgi:hypothetical protein